MQISRVTLSAVSVVALLVGCGRVDGPTEGKPLADLANIDLVQLCERADLQDIVLDIFVEAMFKRNVANAGLFGSIYDQSLSEEKIRQETSIENARAKRHSAEQVNCTADFVANVSSDNKGISEIKFADAQYAVIQQPDNSYQVIAKKATFFANTFIDGLSRDAWTAARQMEAQSAREAEAVESGSDGYNEQLRPQDAEVTDGSHHSESSPATAVEEAETRRMAKERGMVATQHGDDSDGGLE
jgi:hypothetical protein